MSTSPCTSHQSHDYYTFILELLCCMWRCMAQTARHEVRCTCMLKHMLWCNGEKTQPKHSQDDPFLFFFYKDCCHALRRELWFKSCQQLNSESNLVPTQDDVKMVPAVGVHDFAEDSEEAAEKGVRLALWWLIKEIQKRKRKEELRWK